MFRIQRINVVKAATIAAVMYMIVIAIFVIPFLLLVAVARVAAPAGIGDQTVAGALVVGLLAVLFYGVLGWIFTAIACAIYNAVAAWIGGIEVRVEAVAPPAPPPAWMSTAEAPPTTPPSAPAT
jgi:hypothetical protein